MSITVLSGEEVAFTNELSALSAELWEESAKIEGVLDDPVITSIKLYRRLWSNYRGYVALSNLKLQIEADIILRSALEAAICISANFVMREDFSKLVRGDLVATLKSQIKRWREDGDLELVQRAEAQLRKQMPSTPENPKAFSWKELAEVGGQPLLYAYHKNLSMQSSHVTGISLMRGVIGADGSGSDLQEQLGSISRKMHLMIMVGALMLGTKLHASVAGLAGIDNRAAALSQRLNELSLAWT